MLVRHRWVWLGNLLLLGLFALLYLSLTETPTNETPVTSRDVVVFAYRSVVDTFLPGLLGGPLTDGGGGAIWLTPPLAVRVVTGAAAVALVVVSAVRSGRRALLPWLFLAGYLAVDLAIVATTRLGVFGPVIASDARYLADAVPVAVLCAAFALRGRRPGAAEPSARGRVLVGGLTALVVVGGLVSFVRVAPELQFDESREYVATARAELAQRPGMVLFDGPVPGPVMVDWFIADAFTSRVVGLVPESPRFDRPTEELYRLDAEGRARPVIDLIDTTGSIAGPEPDCGYLIGTEPVPIPLEDKVSGRRIVRIGYYTGDAGDGTVRVGGTEVTVRFEAGLHVVHVVATGEYTHVEVGRDLDVAPLCVTDVTVGLPG